MNGVCPTHGTEIITAMGPVTVTLRCGAVGNSEVGFRHLPQPCPECGVQTYSDATLAAAAMGEVTLDPNPTHLCKPDQIAPGFSRPGQCDWCWESALHRTISADEVVQSCSRHHEFYLAHFQRQRVLAGRTR